MENSVGRGLALSLVFSGYWFGKILFTPLIGRWSDRNGRSHFLVLGLSIYSLISFCYLFTPNDLLLLIGLRFMQGIGAASVRPIALAVIGDHAPPNHEGRVMGTFDISFYSALAAGPIAGGVIQDLFGFPGIFGALFVLCFLSLLIALWVGPNIGKPKKVFEEFKVDYRRIVKSRVLLGLFCFIFTRSFGIILYAIYLPILMSGYLKLSNIQIGIIMASGTTITAVFLRPLGRLSDRLNRKLLIIIGGGMAAFLTFFLPFGLNFWYLLFLSMGIGFFSALSLPASSALLIEEGNRYGMGMTVGLFNSMMDAGFVVAPLLGGFLMAIGQWSFIFQGAGLIGILGVYFFSLLYESVYPEPMAHSENYTEGGQRDYDLQSYKRHWSPSSKISYPNIPPNPRPG